jgi:ubiquinone/menaquinone biosynthesis C-methylase UbiE
MHMDHHHFVCPAELAYSLDNWLRKLVHNPGKILRPYLSKGMTVLDLGCGPGYFSLGIARIVTSSGKVIAADLQEKMLEKVNRKISETEFSKIFELQKCQADRICVIEKVDFVLAFWMIHEVPDKAKLFAELKSIIKPEGKIFIVEPKFHVTKSAFDNMLSIIHDVGFKVVETPKVAISRAVILKL